MSHVWDALEIPMAGGALSVAVLSLVYEGIGIAWLPLLGPAIQEMFKGTPDSYYPRHGTAMDGTKAADEPAYTLLCHGTSGVQKIFRELVYEMPSTLDPRNQSPFYGPRYLCMYGLLGTAGQTAGWKLSPLGPALSLPVRLQGPTTLRARDV